jgi:tripartite-type tricarboxylate transporter receptor subunit TctC
MHTTTRRQTLARVAAFAALPVFGRATAQTYPDKPIELIVPFAAGGGTDVLARALAEAARPHLGQSLIVVNRAGASGGVGWSELIHARPDGYKLAIITVEITMIPHMGVVKFSSDDVLPIARLNADPATLAVPAESRHKTVEAFLAAARQAPGSLRVGNAGPGSLGHLAAAALEDKAGVRFTHVPFRGANPAVLDLLGGHIDAVVGGWRGLAAPKGTPAPVLAVLRDAMAKTLREPALRDTMAKQNMGEGYLDDAAFKEVIARDNTIFRELIQRLGIKPG